MTSDFDAPEVLSVATAFLIGSLVRYFHAFWGQYIGIPFSLVIIVIGCALKSSSVYLEYGDLLTASFDLRGDHVMLIVFPLILFYAAYRIPLHSLRILWKQILLTAVLGKSVSIAIVATASTLILGTKDKYSWDILIGMIFATFVCTIDSLDVTEAVHRSGCDRSVSVLMEANALIGNGIVFAWHSVFLRVLLHYLSESLSTEAFLHAFFVSFLGPPLSGVACGFLLSAAMSHTYNFWPSEVLIMMSAPFLTSWAAYHIFGVSGLTSAITLGLWMNYKKVSVSVKVQSTVEQLLETFAYILEVFIFLLLGYLLTEMCFDISVQMPTYRWLTLHSHLILYAFVVWSHHAILNIFMPLLCRMDHGKQLYDLRNLFLMTWTTPRGAGAMIMLHHAFDLNGEILFQTRSSLKTDLEISVVVIIAISQILQCTTMGKCLRFLAANGQHAESPVANLTRLGFLEMLLDLRNEHMKVLKEDQYLLDVQWDTVMKRTDLDVTGMGLKRPAHDDSCDGSHDNAHNPKVLTAQINCMDCPKSSNLPRELVELNEMVLSRMIKAKKMSFRRQYECGMLTTSAMKALDDMADEAASRRKELTSVDVQQYLKSHISTIFKNSLENMYHEHGGLQKSVLIPPGRLWRRALFEILHTAQFQDILQTMIVLNVLLAVTGWALHSDQASVAVIRALTIIILFLNAGFAVVYTVEAALKMCGLGFRQYFGSSFITWNRLDFVILLLTYADMVMDVMCLLHVTNLDSYSEIDPSAIRFLRLARVLRASRVLRLLQPLSPYALWLIDILVTGHLYEAYNVARGFVIAQEEVIMVMGQLVAFVPMVVGHRSKAEQDAREISQEIGFLNQRRPDIATAVKTRQAIRAVLNTIESAVTSLKSQGIIEADEFEKIDNELDISMKKLGNLPHRMPMTNPDHRLRNMPWVSGNEKIFGLLKTAYRLRSMDIGSTFLRAGETPDGIYIIINGTVNLKTPIAVKDHERFGEIYNTDNIKTIYDDSFVTMRGRTGSVELALPGNALNEQALLIGFKRRADAVAETKVDVLFIPAEGLFEAFKLAPELEKLMWKHIVVSVVINMELRMKAFNVTGYGDEKMRLAGGIIRLAKPGRIVAELDMFAEVFLIVGSVVDLRDNYLHQSPTRLPSSTKDVKVKSGRTVSKASCGKIMYPDYAVFFMVPDEGIELEEPFIHDSQFDLSTSHAPVDSFGSMHQFRASVVNRTLRETMPTKSAVNLLTAGFEQAPTVDLAEAVDDEAELHAAHQRAKATRRVLPAAINAGIAASIQAAITTEHNMRIKAAGYQTAEDHRLHQHDLPHNSEITEEESTEEIHERHIMRHSWWHT